MAAEEVVARVLAGRAAKWALDDRVVQLVVLATEPKLVAVEV